MTYKTAEQFADQMIDAFNDKEIYWDRFPWHSFPKLRRETIEQMLHVPQMLEDIYNAVHQYNLDAVLLSEEIAIVLAQRLQNDSDNQQLQFALRIAHDLVRQFNTRLSDELNVDA